MNDIKLTYDELESIANELKNSSTAMEEILRDITNEFEKIGNDDTWSGTAANETKITFNELSRKFPEFSKAVEDCYKYLTQIVIPNYQAVDAAITGKN